MKYFGNEVEISEGFYSGMQGMLIGYDITNDIYTVQLKNEITDFVSNEILAEIPASYLEMVESQEQTV